MRVNVVLHQLDRSGGCRVLLAAADALAARGHEVVVVVPRGRTGRTFEVSGQVEVREVGPRVPAGSELWTLASTLGLAARLPAAEVCLFSYYLCAWPVVIWRLGRGARVGVYFVQGNEPLVFGMYAPKFRILRRTLADWSLRLSWVFLGNSTYTAELVRQRYGSPCTVISPGVDTSTFRPDGLAERPERPRVAVTGSTSRTKGWSMVADTIHQLDALVPDLEVIAIGNSPLAGLERLKGQVRWVSPQSDVEMAEVLRSSSVFFSSSIDEGFGLPVLESMAVGTPVVATDSRGVRDVLRHGANGVLVRYGEPLLAARAILSLLRDEQLRGRYREAGLATAHQFTWERFGSGICAAFDRLA